MEILVLSLLHATLTSEDEESNAGIEKLCCLGIGLLGCLAMYALLNLMAVSGAAICKLSFALYQRCGSGSGIIRCFLDPWIRIRDKFFPDL